MILLKNIQVFELYDVIIVATTSVCNPQLITLQLLSTRQPQINWQRNLRNYVIVLKHVFIANHIKCTYINK